MSSHHIVREKQEPALFILDIDGFDEEHLGQLLEWSPTLAVTEKCYEQIASQGIKVDIVILNTDSVINFQESIKFIYIDSLESSLQEGLKFLIIEGYPAVNIICDNFNADNFKDYVDKIDLVIFANQKKYYPIKSGFNKWDVKNREIEVYNEPFEYFGVKKTAMNNFITLQDGFYGFAFNQKNLFIAEEL